jgi:hypothetical protein
LLCLICWLGLLLHLLGLLLLGRFLAWQSRVGGTELRYVQRERGVLGQAKTAVEEKRCKSSGVGWCEQPSESAVEGQA